MWRRADQDPTIAAGRPRTVPVDLMPRWRGRRPGPSPECRAFGRHRTIAWPAGYDIAASEDVVVAPEGAPFSVYGERGVIDMLIWHPARRALLVVELKTEIVDVNELLGTLDRKRRLAKRIARERGWPGEIGRVGAHRVGDPDQSPSPSRRSDARSATACRPTVGAARAWLADPSWRMRRRLALEVPRARRPAGRGGASAGRGWAATGDRHAEPGRFCCVQIANERNAWLPVRACGRRLGRHLSGRWEHDATATVDPAGNGDCWDGRARRAARLPRPDDRRRVLPAAGRRRTARPMPTDGHRAPDRPRVHQRVRRQRPGAAASSSAPSRSTRSRPTTSPPRSSRSESRSCSGRSAGRGSRSRPTRRRRR